jgi:phage regulator Rha-like protein
MHQKIAVLTRRVESTILVMRGRKVILDSDLAKLYGVTVKRLNEQVKRNADRFPADFMFQVKERDLRSQIGTSHEGLNKRGGRRYQPYAFSEHGAIMAATVLNSARAVEMTVFVVRAFVGMREALATNNKIVAKLKDLEQHLGKHDTDIQQIVAAIRELMKPSAPPGRKIGFAVPARRV